MNIFQELLKFFRVGQEDPLHTDLVKDSQLFLEGKEYYLDFFLEIFKLCYSKNEVKNMLILLDLKKVKLPKELNKNNYSSILDLIEEKPNIITKYCNENENKDKYYKKFYIILLYFRINYEKDKIQTLINQKDLWKYFIEILPLNSEYFCNIELPNELIDEMLNQEPLLFETINGTIKYLKSFEKILNYINKNCNSIYDICKKENKIINLSDLINPIETDNLYKIKIELEKLINYEINNTVQFITFNDTFWGDYIYYFKKDFKKLILIKKCILICQIIDKNLNPEY